MSPSIDRLPIGDRRPIPTIVGTIIASVAFVAQAPLGVLPALALLGLLVATPAPLAVAFGHIALGALFGGSLGPRLLLAETGLLVLALASLPSLRERSGRRAVAISFAFLMICLGGYVLLGSIDVAIWLRVIGLTGAVGIALYLCHRYERLVTGQLETETP